MKKTYSMPATLCLAALAGIAVLGACSKAGKLTSENFNVTPTPLEYSAGEVPATISINFPEKFFKKNYVVSCIPVLKAADKEVVGNVATFQGEKVLGNDQTINYKQGGNATLKTNFKYSDELIKSDLIMRFEAVKSNSGKTVNIPDVKIGYGVVATAQLISKTAQQATPAICPDGFQREISKKQTATIKFLIAQANLRGSELNNSNVKDFIATLKKIKSDDQSLVLNNIDVSAYASPDGSYKFNEKLAEHRGSNSANFVKNQLKKARLKGNVDTKYTAEDWEGFQALVSQSNLPDKDIILRVLSMYQDPEQREQEIRNVALLYKELADAVLPELRRARMVINYDVIGRSDDAIMELVKTNAAKLSLEELIYAANTLSTTDAEKEMILKKVVALFPQDYRAYNNLGEIALRTGRVDDAQGFFRQALSINPNASEPNVNLGMMAIQNGNFQDAEMFIAKGVAANNIDEALGHLYLAQGKYSQASAKFAKSANNSAVLSNILSQDYADAQKILTNIKNPDAMTFYLRAILAARMNEKAAVKDYLAQAIALDPSMAKRAANDAEFSDYNK
jgi:Flp pilus assembly protein TadD